MSEEIKPKSFDDLKKEVHEKGLCGECGGCVSFCSAHELKAIQMPRRGAPVYSNEEQCLHCGICYLVCPQTSVLHEELAGKYHYKPPIGNWTKVSSAQARSEDIRARATDGGVVTAILTYLLDNYLIDGAIVSKPAGPFNRVPIFANTSKLLLEAAGSHFTMSGHMTELENYTTFSPSIPELKTLYERDVASIALVGTPCQIHSLRKMQELRIIPSHVVKYAIGLFCNMNYSVDEDGCKRMEKQLKFSLNDMERMNIKEDIKFHLKDNSIVHVDFDTIKEYGRPACFTCTDFSNVYADISFGGLGSKDGFTTTIVRTRLGARLYQDVITNGLVIEPPEHNTSVKKSEMLAKVMNFSEMKRLRAIGARKSELDS